MCLSLNHDQGRHLGFAFEVDVILEPVPLSAA